MYMLAGGRQCRTGPLTHDMYWEVGFGDFAIDLP